MQTFRKQKSIDSFCQKASRDVHFDWPLAKFVRRRKKPSVLFSKHGKIENFSTESLGIHFVKSEKQPDFRSLDGFLNFEKRIPVSYAFKNKEYIHKAIRERYGDVREYAKSALAGFFQEKSLVKAWNVSIVGAFVFGMFIMTFIYRYLGQDVSAGQVQANPASAAEALIAEEPAGKVLGEEIEELDGESDAKAIEDYVSKIIKDYEKESEGSQELEEEIKKMVKGYPIEKMVSFIAKEDKVVAAFLVGIAKKESDWGKRVPVLSGKDCYNYWGYRGKREKMGTGGHTCFDSPKDAVETVAKRLKFLVSSEKMTTPGKMVVVWKCGYDCSWDSPEAVKKWVSDVDHYFKKFDKFGG